MEINKHLIQQTIDVVEKINKIEAEERAAFETLEIVELNNGEFLSKAEQLAFFEKVFECAETKKACLQYLTFKSFYENGNYYDAWSILLGNNWWLRRNKLLKKDGFPKSISIGKTYFATGYVQEKSIYKYELQNGECVRYYETGQIHGSCLYECGTRNGVHISYRANGRIYLKSVYSRGYQNGECVLFYENGQVSMSCPYKKDKRNGDCILFTEEGVIWHRSSYKNGVMI